MNKEQSAKFAIGHVIHHKKFDYRGVIIDVDPIFSGSDEWYEAVAKSRPPKDRPWYHVIVEGSTGQTYVAERHLEPDSFQMPVNHPLIEFIFSDFKNGKYSLKEDMSLN